MALFKQKRKNRRLGRGHDVLDVKLRSSKVRAARTRLAAVVLGIAFGTVFGLYLLWRAGDWALNEFVYENPSFAVRRIDVQTDGVISLAQLLRWSGVRLGENLLALDLSRVQRDLILAPRIRSASVERILPGTLRIRVTERVPIAQINVPCPGPGGGLQIVVYQVDPGGYILRPLDPRQRAVPLSQSEDQLPVIRGINVAELQPGRRIASPQLQAALQLIQAFESSPMAGQVELSRVDVSVPQVLVATTGQGSQITFGLDNFEQQLPRWQLIYRLGLRMNKVIATLDLAVSNNIPATWLEASSLPPPTPRNTKTPRTRRNNV